MTSMNQPNPLHAEISEAVAQYLQAGGTIKHLPSGVQASDSASISQTQRNKANAVKEKRNMRMFQGQMRTTLEISAMTGIPWQTIKSRIGHGKTLEEAVAMPYRRNSS